MVERPTAEPLIIPSQPALCPDTAPEQKATIACNLSVAKTPVFLTGRFSNYHQTITITAWCLRFIANLKAHRNESTPILTPALNLSELKTAELLLFHQSQSLYFDHEATALQSNNTISSKSKLLSLSPFLDQDGLL